MRSELRLLASRLVVIGKGIFWRPTTLSSDDLLAGLGESAELRKTMAVCSERQEGVWRCREEKGTSHHKISRMRKMAPIREPGFLSSTLICYIRILRIVKV